MKGEKPVFTVTAVGWLPEGALETPQQEKVRHKVLALFLQENGLVTRTLLSPGEEVTESFAIRSSDLTEEGLELMRTGYQRWLAALDRSQSKEPPNLEILRRALLRIRADQG